MMEKVFAFYSMTGLLSGQTDTMACSMRVLPHAMRKNGKHSQNVLYAYVMKIREIGLKSPFSHALPEPLRGTGIKQFSSEWQ
jgi:hypothetical protein